MALLTWRSLSQVEAQTKHCFSIQQLSRDDSDDVNDDDDVHDKDDGVNDDDGSALVNGFFLPFIFQE